MKTVPEERLYLIQKHDASRLHYDFRLELDGVLKSWAVPKGPSLDPADKRLAVHVEDHPLEYGSFEGVIPEGEYGGGTVMLWDTGRWEPEGDPREGYRNGKLAFQLHGKRLQGKWALIRMRGRDEKNWLLVKEKDEKADSEAGDGILEEDASAATGRSMDAIAKAKDRVWNAEEGEVTAKAATAKKTRPNKQDALDPSVLKNARKGKLPAEFAPQLATLVKEPPGGDAWLHEVKYDGYRLVCIMDNKNVRIITRNGNDWTRKFPEIAGELPRLPVKQAILDGEVVIINDDGASDFQALQNALKGKREGVLRYYVFDLPYCEGYDLTRTPLSDRKELLAQVLRGGADVLRYSDHIVGKGKTVYEQACGMKLEGLVCKRINSPYERRRSRNWLKVKCIKRQEFVVGGFTDPSGSRTGFGALVLGYYDNGKLVYCGRVGTGFDDRTLEQLHGEMQKREQKQPAFDKPPTGRDAKGVHWLKPELVAEVEFAEWTKEGILRHPSFQGLREDKKPKDVHREKPMATEKAEVMQSPADKQAEGAHATKPANRNRKERAVVAGVTLSNPDRVMYPEQGYTKKQVAEYYEQVAEWVLPHVVKRPLTIIRCPQGHDKECFYQKHLTEALPEAVRGVKIKEKAKAEEYIVIDDLKGLVSLVQMGAMEFHPWGAREDRVERPDLLTFDLDPAPDTAWDVVIDGARLLHDRLEELGLESFLKTSGGKGLHVVVPLVRRSDWDEVKAFSKAVAEEVVAREPKRYIATMSKAKRTGKVFVDYLRNARGATAVAAYSTRARPGAPVATPLRWDELSDNLRPNAYTIENIMARLNALKADPWNGFSRPSQSITAAAKEELGVK